MKEIKSTLEQLGFKGKPLPMMTEFLTENDTVKGEELYDTYYDAFHMVVTYKNFTTQPLTKGHFVPCDLYGNVLDKPERYGLWLAADRLETFKSHFVCVTYQQAESRVLFENPYDVVNGWETESYKKLYRGTIEQAINAGVKLILK